MKRVTFLKLGANGRLGNQLFQIAATIGLAKKHRAEYIFKGWRYNKYMKNPVPTSLSVYARRWALYRQPHFHYGDIPPGPDFLSLAGYFQSEKFFKHCESEIRHHFTLKDAWVNYIKNQYPQLKDKTCSIHVRRGDYLSKQDFHQALPVSYYEKAARKLYGDPSDGVNFLVFSDDIEWCKQNLKFPRMTFIEGEKDIIDLYIMSMCGDHIIANSSFSWWAAWLNQNSNRVVAPNNWFGPNLKADTRDLYCDHWIKI